MGAKRSNRSNDLCLSGETKFRSPEGDTSIRALAKRFQTKNHYRFPVYAVDTVTGDQRLVWMSNAWKTGTKPTLKIGFDDGSFVRLTSDHVLFKKTRRFEGKRCVGLKIEEVKAGDLNVGDRVLASLPKRSRTKGYVKYKTNLFKNTGFKNMYEEHRAYWELVTGEEVGEDIIHHEDGDYRNNRFCNLERLSRREHGSHHLSLDNPNYKMTETQIFERASKGGKTHKGRTLSAEHRKSLSESAKSAQSSRERDHLGRYASNHKSYF